MFFDKFKRINYKYLNRGLVLVLVFLLIFNLTRLSLAEEIKLVDKTETIQEQEAETNESKEDQSEIGINEQKEGGIKLKEKEPEPSVSQENEEDEKALLEVEEVGEKEGREIKEIEIESKVESGKEDDAISEAFLLTVDKEEKVDEDNNEKCTLKNRNGLDKVRLNEIFPFPSEGAIEVGRKEDWIELYNMGDDKVDLGGCCLVDGRYKPSKKNIEKCFFVGENNEIRSGEYKIFERSEFKFDINNKSEDGIFFLDSEGNILDKAFYSGKAKENYFYALNFKNKWQWTEFLTFGEANEFKIYSEKLEITELMPNPEGADGGKEWVEILNNDDKKIELTGWSIVNHLDKEFGLDDLEVLSGQRLKVEIFSTSSFLRNSKGVVKLKDPNGEIVDEMAYLESAKENASLNKNLAEQWSWSIFATPGAENKFNSLPTYKVDIPDKIYEDIKTEFKIKKVEDLDGEDLKYRWDFGDESKSYLQETTHTFSKKDRYTIQTRVSDLSADVFKLFEIKVEKFPQFDLKIVKILPNPKGKDNENEKIWIENQENKTINLKGWIIATGENTKKLTNHYIKDDFKIKAGKTKALNRDDCPFSLLNKKGRVELKSPNGETIDKVKYEKEKIKEDELYYLENDFWIWSKLVLAEEKKSIVLGDTSLNLIQASEKEKAFMTMNELLRNSRLSRTDGFKVTFFNNWLFIQSQNLFFKFIFPSSYWNRFSA